jgi:hypothetical protein
MADEMFEAVMKSVGKGQGDHVVLQNHPACACADWIKEWELMFEKLKKNNSKIKDLAIKVKKATKELDRIKDEKSETR